jgi:hypothetical protein
VRETLRLALEELGQALPEKTRPDCWPVLWERYVENKLDYRSSAEVLQSKRVQAGQDCLLLLQWLETTGTDLRHGGQVELLREVFDQQFEVKANKPEAVEQHAAGVVLKPARPRRAMVGQGPGQTPQELGGLQSAGSRDRGRGGRKNSADLHRFGRHAKGQCE